MYAVGDTHSHMFPVGDGGGEEELWHVCIGGRFQLRRLPVRSERGQGQTHTRTLEDLDRQDTVNTVRTGMPGPTVHVPHRSTHSNRKTSPPGATSPEAHTVALEKQL